MPSSQTKDHVCAHPVVDPDHDFNSSTNSQTYDCCRVSSGDFVSSEVPEAGLGPTVSSRHEYSNDDIAISSRPICQVDYLSHDWKEEDIWMSWRYIVIGRGTLLDQVRLENAVWRTWAKIKNSLKTVPPETLNWRKEHDITWLYGPLHLTQNPFGLIKADLCRVPLGKAKLHRDATRKPILKRRSTFEDKLDRSVLTASLLNRTSPAVDVQNTKRFYSPLPGRSQSHNPSRTISKRSQTQESNCPSECIDPLRIESPSVKRTRFNERVEQCVIVDHQVSNYDDNRLDDSSYCSNTDSDDDTLMKCADTEGWALSQRKVSELKFYDVVMIWQMLFQSPKVNITQERSKTMYKGKGISMLPPAALKSGEDTNETRMAR